MKLGFIKKSPRVIHIPIVSDNGVGVLHTPATVLERFKTCSFSGTENQEAFSSTSMRNHQLGEDMEVELSDLFPKHSDLRFQAVRLLMHIQEYEPQKQTGLAKVLEVEDYAMSRLITKLEHARYVTRSREGTDKIVSITSQD